MVSYLLSVLGVVPEIVGLVCAVIEAITVSTICILRIVKMIAQIKAAFRDDDPNNYKQVEDIVDGTIKDIQDDQGKGTYTPDPNKEPETKNEDKGEE